MIGDKRRCIPSAEFSAEAVEAIACVAAETWRKDSRSLMLTPGMERVREQFDRQAREAIDLADAIANGRRIIIRQVGWHGRANAHDPRI